MTTTVWISYAFDRRPPEGNMEVKIHAVPLHGWLINYICNTRSRNVAVPSSGWNTKDLSFGIRFIVQFCTSVCFKINSKTLTYILEFDTLHIDGHYLKWDRSRFHLLKTEMQFSSYGNTYANPEVYHVYKVEAQKYWWVVITKTRENCDRRTVRILNIIVHHWVKLSFHIIESLIVFLVVCVCSFFFKV